jgi:hypothetical protein
MNSFLRIIVKYLCKVRTSYPKRGVAIGVYLNTQPKKILIQETTIKLQDFFNN